MTREEVLRVLKEREMTEVIELIEDAEAGELEELELLEGLELLADEELNRAVLNLLADLGVTITYARYSDEDDDEEVDDE